MAIDGCLSPPHLTDAWLNYSWIGEQEIDNPSRLADGSVGNWLCWHSIAFHHQRQHGLSCWPLLLSYSFSYYIYTHTHSVLFLFLFFLLGCLRGFTVGRDVNEPFPVPAAAAAAVRPRPSLAAARQDRIHSVRVLESIKCIFNRATLKNTHTHPTLSSFNPVGSLVEPAKYYSKVLFLFFQWIRCITY